MGLLVRQVEIAYAQAAHAVLRPDDAAIKSEVLPFFVKMSADFAKKKSMALSVLLLLLQMVHFESGCMDAGAAEVEDEDPSDEVASRPPAAPRRAALCQIY